MFGRRSVVSTVYLSIQDGDKKEEGRAELEDFTRADITLPQQEVPGMSGAGPYLR